MTEAGTTRLMEIMRGIFVQVSDVLFLLVADMFLCSERNGLL